jgi:hypothetical protein
MKGGAENEIISAVRLTNPQQQEQERVEEIRNLLGKKVIVTPLEAKMSNSFSHFARKGTFVLKALHPEIDLIADDLLEKIDNELDKTQPFQNIQKLIRDSVMTLPFMSLLFFPLDTAAAVVGTANTFMVISKMFEDLYSRAEDEQLKKEKRIKKGGDGAKKNKNKNNVITMILYAPQKELQNGGGEYPIMTAKVITQPIINIDQFKEALLQMLAGINAFIISDEDIKEFVNELSSVLVRKKKKIMHIAKKHGNELLTAIPGISLAEQLTKTKDLLPAFVKSIQKANAKEKEYNEYEKNIEYGTENREDDLQKKGGKTKNKKRDIKKRRRTRKKFPSKKSRKN